MPYICPDGREIKGPGAQFIADQGRDPILGPNPIASALELFFGENHCAAAALASDPTGVVSARFCRMCAHRLGKHLDQLDRTGKPLPQKS